MGFFSIDYVHVVGEKSEKVSAIIEILLTCCNFKQKQLKKNIVLIIIKKSLKIPKGHSDTLDPNEVKKKHSIKVKQ